MSEIVTVRQLGQSMYKDAALMGRSSLHFSISIKSDPILASVHQHWQQCQQSRTVCLIN